MPEPSSSTTPRRTSSNCRRAASCARLMSFERSAMVWRTVTSGTPLFEYCETLTPAGCKASAGKPSSRKKLRMAGTVLIGFGLGRGKIARLGGIGEAPGGEVGSDIALGQPAHGDRAVCLAGADQAVAQQIAADDQAQRDHASGGQPAAGFGIAQECSGGRADVGASIAHGIASLVMGPGMRPQSFLHDEPCLICDEWSSLAVTKYLHTMIRVSDPAATIALFRADRRQGIPPL